MKQHKRHYLSIYESNLDELIDTLTSKREELKDFQPVELYIDEGEITLFWDAMETDEEYEERVRQENEYRESDIESLKRLLSSYGYDPSKLDSIKAGDGLS